MMGMILMNKKKFPFFPQDIVAVIVSTTVYSSEIEGRNDTGVKKSWLSVMMKRRLEMNRLTSKNSVAVATHCFQN